MEKNERNKNSMNDCAYCLHFKWLKRKDKSCGKVFDIPQCLKKNIAVNDPKIAEKCEEYQNK